MVGARENWDLLAAKEDERRDFAVVLSVQLLAKQTGGNALAFLLSPPLSLLFPPARPSLLLTTSMIPIARDRLNSELAYRVDFDRQFIEFTKEDASALNAAAPLLLPIITDM